MNGEALNRDGRLKEFSGNTLLKNWKVKYEQKGHSRGTCNPPMLNLSFDKTDSQGKPRQLFNGSSTYGDYTELQYQKIRLIPECDIGSGDLGFNGQLEVLLREYTVHSIFRQFGIPVADVIGFANVKFVTPDSEYNGKSFRYIIIQRPNEKDDQIPFTTQFKLKPDLYESGDKATWIPLYTTSNRLTHVDLKNYTSGDTLSLNFDIDTTVKFLLLSDFLDLHDMNFLQNEEYGVNTLGKGFIIPHGFDLSFACKPPEPRSLQLNNLIKSLPANYKTRYISAYSRISKEIFGNKNSLEKMLDLVDDFPFSADREKLKDFLTLRFYQYSSYFTSPAFATNIGQRIARRSSSVRNDALPFSTYEEYTNRLNQFLINCEGGQIIPTIPSIPESSPQPAYISTTITKKVPSAPPPAMPIVTIPDITPKIIVLYPNGGESWTHGQNQTIRWSSLNIPSNARIGISMYKGNTREVGKNIIVGLGSNATSYNWKVDTVDGWVYAEAPLAEKFVKLLGVKTVEAEGNQYIIYVSAYWGNKPDYVADGSNLPFNIVLPVVVPASIIPSIDLKIDGSSGPFSVKSGAYITPSFISSNASYCLNNWDATARDTMNYGTTIGPVTSSKTYTVTCYSATGHSFSDSVAVNITLAVNSPSSLTANAINANISANQNITGTVKFNLTQYQKQGSFGREVIELQKFLNQAGYNTGSPDGVFSAKTKEAVIQLQIANGLKSDGIVGREVRDFLNR